MACSSPEFVLSGCEYPGDTSVEPCDGAGFAVHDVDAVVGVDRQAAEDPSATISKGASAVIEGEDAGTEPAMIPPNNNWILGRGRYCPTIPPT
jgi:hypothetical protein